MCEFLGYSEVEMRGIWCLITYCGIMRWEVKRSTVSRTIVRPGGDDGAKSIQCSQTWAVTNLRTQKHYPVTHACCRLYETLRLARRLTPHQSIVSALQWFQ
jgi:hypothetical protein